MKTIHLTSTLLLLACSLPAAMDLTSVPSPSGTEQRTLVQPWQVVSRGGHQNVWEAMSSVRDARSGLATLTRHRFVELGTGLNALSEKGEWVPANPNFAITPEAAEAHGAQHKVRVVGDLSQEGAIQLTTPDGLRQRSHPVAVAWYDPLDGSSVILAVVTNATGYLTSPNEIVFSNCFSGLSASIVLRNALKGLSQTLLLHESPGLPEAFGLSAAARLELMTEFTPDCPMPARSETVLSRESDPALRSRMVEPDLVDETLTFGSMTMTPGKGFTVGSCAQPERAARDSVPVAKRFMILNGRPVLVESVEHRRVRAHLEKLSKNSLQSSVRPSASGAPVCQ